MKKLLLILMLASLVSCGGSDKKKRPPPVEPAPCTTPACTDSDGDGVFDDTDVFPNDATESKDTDGDGVGDNADVFPNDPDETIDTDLDGIGNNADLDDDGDKCVDTHELEFGTDPLDGTDCINDFNVFQPADIANKSSYELQNLGIDFYAAVKNFRFDDQKSRQSPAAIAAADFNHDGLLDFVVGYVTDHTGADYTELSNTTHFMINDGKGLFIEKTDDILVNPEDAKGWHPRKILLGDYNNDGLLDVFVSEYGPHGAGVDNSGADNVLLMSENGKYTASRHAPSTRSHGSASADIDNDGDIDILQGAEFETEYLENVGGVFLPSRTIAGSTPHVITMELIKINNDDDCYDMVYYPNKDTETLRIGYGNCTTANHFTDQHSEEIAGVRYSLVHDVLFEDFNGDGAKTLLVLSSSVEETNSVVQEFPYSETDGFGTPTTIYSVEGYFPWWLHNTANGVRVYWGFSQHDTVLLEFN